MAYYKPHTSGYYNPLYTANNQGFGHCSFEKEPCWIMAGQPTPIGFP